MTVQDMLEDVSTHYRLDVDVYDHMELSYTIFVGNKWNTKKVKLEDAYLAYR